MNNWASRLISWLAGLGAIAAMFYRSKAATEKAKREADNAEHADERADRAEHTANTYQKINAERAKLHKKQQEEITANEQKNAASDRDHFDNSWH